MSPSSFFNLYNQGFIRAAVCVPEVRVALPLFNAQKTIELAQKAARQKAALAVFPELGISACSNEDLFHQRALLDEVEKGLVKIKEASAKLKLVLAVGAPLRIHCRLFNCAVIFHEGKILGVAVKSFLPNYREYDEGRRFSPATEALASSISVAGQNDVPIGANLIFRAVNVPDFNIFFEIGADLWAVIPPSNLAALAGATIIGNLSATNATVGKARFLSQLAANQSARCFSAYLYANAGFGESTTDLAWDGHALIYENGDLLAESQRFLTKAQMIYSDIDLDRLAQERLRMNIFSHNALDYQQKIVGFRTIAFECDLPGGRLLPVREIPRFPCLPADKSVRDLHCYEACAIQVQGLAQRLKSSGIANLALGVSGGLDSTLALLVASQTMDLLGLPRTNIKAYTLPSFGTTSKTRANALALMKALGVEGREIDIKPACRQMLQDIGHPFARGKKIYDVAFENVQAGQRTAHLFRLANMKNALVVGTGDLSELALGWSTYGVGDHMSHYNVNAGVPKTMIQYLIRWVAQTEQFSAEVSQILLAVLETEISPELIPGNQDDRPHQKTEEIIGPYELQDFNNFYITRFGFLPGKVAFLGFCAWRDKKRGAWPDVPPEKQNSYSMKEIKKWLFVYLTRFFKTSQYKRSCSPNGPKVLSDGGGSPRGDWRAPSDNDATVWLKNWEKIPESE